MKKSLIFIFSLLIIIFTISSCKKSTTTASEEEQAENGGEVTISGKVVDNDTESGIEGVIISIDGTKSFNDRYSQSGGDFEFILTLDGNQTMTFTFSLEGYETQVIERKINVADNKIDLGTIKLAKQLINSTVSGPPHAIQFVSMSSPNIFVQETGDVTWTNIVYMVVDSNGNAIDIDHSIAVNFSFGEHPDGGEEIGPPTVKTNSSGEAATTVRSGTVAGPVQIIAQFNYNGKAVKSRPTNLTISSGFPDQDHFSVGTTQLNYAYWHIVNAQPRPQAVAVVGDIYSNPVVTGTAVWFSTDAGVIEGYQNPQHTDRYGVAEVDIMTGAPWPNDPVLGEGFFQVHAKTIDGNNQFINTSTTVLFSGKTILTITPKDVAIPTIGAGQQTFYYTVSDARGNPLAKGTQISVTLAGENIKAVGDVSFTLPDTQDRANTSFTFTVYEVLGSLGEDLPQRDVSISVSVKSPNGDATVTLNGTAF